MQFTETEAAAIERFTLSVTVPILYDKGDSAPVFATGTLFEIDGRFFIITARHVLDNIHDSTKLVYPESPLQGQLFTLGSIEIYKPKEEHIDIAVMELKNLETIQRLKTNWKFLSLNNVSSPSEVSGDGAFFVSGYPQALTEADNSRTKSKFVTAYTQRMPSAPAEAKYVIPELDLFFVYEEQAISVSGATVSTPELPGVSGASIWELRSTSGIWSPEKVARVVGIQSAYIHSKYLRATRWWAVAKVLEQVDETLATRVSNKLAEILAG